jgi:hypothetical protein
VIDWQKRAAGGLQLGPGHGPQSCFVSIAVPLLAV